MEKGGNGRKEKEEEVTGEVLMLSKKRDDLDSGSSGE